MNTERTLTKWIRLVVATAMALAVGVAVNLTGGTPVAEATNSVVPTTSFDIDGDPVGPEDFDAPYGPGVTPDGYPTTGLYFNNVDIDNGGNPCGASDDDQGLGGSKAEDGPVWPLDPAPTSPPNGKSDLEAVYVAAEKVAVPGSQIVDLLYVGYLSCLGGNGSFSTLLYLDNGDGLKPSDGVDGDFLFRFDFNPNDGSVVITMFERIGGTWVEVPVPAGAIDAAAGGEGDFGEVALNLTALGIIDEDTCRTITAEGQTATITGGSLQSQPKDLVAVTPLDISNCGGLDVTKASSPAGLTSPDVFHYVADQFDGETVHDDTLDVSAVTGTTEPDADVTEIDADIQVGDTDMWRRVISQPDYQLAETVIPDGWALKQIECVTTDIFDADGDGDVYDLTEPIIIWGDPDGTGVSGPTGELFLVPPESLGNVALDPAMCTITNSTSGVVVAKEAVGNGDPTTAFDFTVTNDDNVTVVGSPSLVLGASSQLFAITPGDQVTISETLPAANPAWTLDSIACVADTSGAVTPISQTATSITFDTIESETITCTFTNVQNGQIEVIKDGAPTAAGPFGFDDSWSDGNADGAEDFTLNIGDSANSGDLAPGDYTVSELLDATNLVADPDFVGSASCVTTSAGSGTSSSSATGVDATITLGAGDIVTCTFTNVQNGRIVVEKNTVDGDGTFEFTGAVPGSITTDNGTGTTTLSADLAPGSYSIDETPLAGFTLTDITCVDPSGGTTSDVLPGGTGADIDLAAGETVTCTFTNTRNSANFTLAKVWNDAIAADTVTLAADGDDANAEVIENVLAVAPAGNSDSMTVYSGETVDFSETFGPGVQGNYIVTLVCVDGSGQILSTVDSITGQLTIGDNPTDITCTFTNSRRTSSLVLQKEWVNGNGGDTAELTAGAATATSTATGLLGSEVDGTNQAVVTTVFVGDSINLSEVLSAEANYNADLACVGGSLTYTAGDLAGSVEVLQSDEGEQIVCTFTNTRKQANLVLTKTWDDPVADSAVDLVIGGGDAVAIAGSSTSDGATSVDATSVVFAGETLSLTEAFTAGDAANFVDSLDCGAHAVTYTPGDLTGSITIVPADENTTITCTFDNVRKQADLTLEKAWVNPFEGDTYDLTITSTDGGSNTAVAPAASGTSIETATAVVYAGETVTLAEAAGANTGSYTVSAFACSGSTNSLVDWTGDPDVDGTLQIDPADHQGDITCTVTNTRTSTTFTLEKEWVDPVGGGASVTLNATGDDPNLGGTIAESSTSPTAASDTMTVYSGETISFDEAFGDPADEARFSTTLVCADGGGELVDNTDRSGSVAVGADPTPITCTFTNTRLSTNLELRKSWVDSAAGDTYDLAIDATNDAGPTTATAPGGSGDSAEFATIVVYAGETVLLSEVAGAGNLGTYDTTAFSCTAGQDDWAAEATSANLVVEATDIATDPIVCTFTNTRTSTTFTLEKTWDDPAGGATVALLADGSDPLTVDIDDSSTSPTAFSASTTVYSGETVSVSESFTTGDPANYTSALSCTDGTSGEYSADVSIPADPTPITCTFTNTRLRTTLTLDKDWVAAEAGDEANLSISATDSDGPITAVAPAGDGTSAETASITVYAGETVTLGETIDPNGTNVAVYDATAFSCTAGTENPAWAAGNTSVTLDVAAGDVAAPIGCTFTNTAQRGTVVIVKNVEGNGDGTFSFTGDWDEVDGVGFDITTASQTGSVTYQNVLVPKDGAPYVVTETDPTPAFDGTRVICADTDGGSSPIGPDGSTDLPLTGSIELDNGETVTCTFTNTERSTIVIVKDAQPDAAQDFSFTGDLGAFDLDDDADPTLPNTETSALLNAQDGSTYTVDETPTPGWTLDAAASSCTNGDTFGATGVTIDPEPGTTVTCTFVNTANPAGITATKSVEGQVGPWGPFEFTLSGGAFTGDATQAVDNSDLVNGSDTAEWTELVNEQQYTLTEAQVPGYETDAVFTCVVILPGSDGPVELLDADGATDGFQFTAVAGAVYDCDITNVAIPGVVDVTKTVTGVADDYDWAFEFTIAPDAPPANPQIAEGTGNTTSTAVQWTDLVPGTTYTVTETSIPGWTAGAIECTVTPADDQLEPVVTTDGSFAVTPGATVSCDFDNAADPGDVSVTKSVTGVADDYAWAFDFTIDPAAAPQATQTASGTGNTTSTAVTWTGLVPGETYTITETAIPGWTAGAIECTITHADQTTTPLTAASFTVEPGDSISCDFDNAADPGDVSVTKSVTGVADDYAWAFDFSIDPLPALETNPKTASGIGNTTSTPVMWAGLVPGTTYTVTEVLPAGWTAGAIECTVTHAAGAAPVSTITTDGSFTVTPGSTVSCDFDNAANPSEVEITKTVDGGLVVDWSFDFTIDPVPAGETSPKAAAGTGDGTDTVTWGSLIPGETYTVAEVVPTDGFVAGALTCAGLDDLDAVNNTFTFVAPLGLDGVDISCSITNTAQSDVTYSKVVDSVERDAGTGVWTVSYVLTAQNAADAGAGEYSLEDSFNFGAGVSIVADSAAVVNDAPGTITTNAAFDGEGDPNIVTDEPIAAGATHTYIVSVDVTIAVGPGTDGDCISVEGEGTGFLNTMTITIDGGEPETTDACAGFAQLTLVKDLISDDGGNGELADFPLTATGPATLTGVSGTADVSSAVPAGDYTLSEEQLIDGYLASAWSCGEASLAGDVLTLTDGENVTCTIINDDEPVDLELTKDDDGIEAVAGGDPFDYTISVQNIGERDVDLDEPVTVTDELPVGLSWVSFPANCSAAGQTLTCDVDPALLPAGGAAVVITVTVEADADAASGTYTNKASVTTEDDPSTDPECPALDDNNVDCEDTPVDRVGAIQITKVDDVADGESVEPGDTFTYQLVVTNTGTSTILPGTHVEDDLPAQLELVSVAGGAGWTCNDSDPIDCDYAPELAPGEVAPAITVTVIVSAEATGTQIDNVAIVKAAVDRNCPSATERFVETYTPACNEVTDDDDETTPLVANADLAIVKTASVDQIGAGNSFNWTLEITNNGPGTAVNVVVGDLMPNTVTVTAVASDDFDCSNDGNTITCTVASLAVGASGTVTITTQVPTSAAAGTVTNVGTVTADTPDPDLTNNSDDASVVIVAIAPPTTPAPPPVTLPRTGSDGTAPMVQAALLLLISGAIVVLISRRRREEQATTI